MTFLAIKVAGIRSQSTHSQVLLPTLSAHWIVIAVTLISMVALLLRVVPLLTLAGSIPFPFVLPELFGILGKVTSLTLRIQFLVMPGL